MKSGGGGGGGGGKKRWKGLVIGVMVLVVLSMLVPLAFLLGLHNSFHTPGSVTVQHTSPSNGIRNYEKSHEIGAQNHSKRNPSSHIEELVKKLGPPTPKFQDVVRNIDLAAGKDVNRKQSHLKDVIRNNDLEAGKETRRKNATGSSLLPNGNQPSSATNKTRAGVDLSPVNREVTTDETGKNCELKYGTYCLWREEHREEMKDFTVKKMKDRLFVARSYYPTIAKMPSQDKLTHDMKQSIQEFEKILSESTVDAELPPQMDKRLEKMETIITRAKSFPVDCHNVDKKLRQILDLTEDEANFHMKQSVFLYQLAVQTMPKSLHCLSMRLTVEYFKSPPPDLMLSAAEKCSDPSLHHYVIISTNILASSVVINSTVLHSQESRNLVFHVLTDEQNYFGMKLWFFRNTYKEAVVQVLNIERLKLDSNDKATLLRLSLPVEFRVSFQSGDNSATTHYKTHYLSVFSHSHYLIPKIFQNLSKAIVLDDDVVVQRDLSPLWELDMEGKVNGAVKSCSVRLGQLKNYIRGGSLDPNSCSWMSGLNVIDLAKWRELGLSEAYQKVVKDQTSGGDKPAEAIALQASLLTFQDLVYPLDSAWALSGLGHDYSINTQALKRAAVLHYNGNMKPWLEMGIAKYKVHWKKFLTSDDEFLSQCNVNP